MAAAPGTPPAFDGARSLYVGGMDARATEEDLFAVLGAKYEDGDAAGLLTSKVNRDVVTRMSRCSGFINFDTAVNAQRCLNERQHAIVLGRAVVLKAYAAKSPAPVVDDAEKDASPDAIAAGCNTFIKPLPPGCTDDELAKFAETQFPGVIKSVHVPPGRPFGYILFTDQKAAAGACSRGQILFTAPEDKDSKPLLVTLTMYKSFGERNPSVVQVAATKAAGSSKQPQSAPVVLNKANSIIIKGCPGGWTKKEVTESCKVYGEIKNLRIDESVKANAKDVVVEFAVKDAVAKACEGLNGRYTNAIDRFTLLGVVASANWAIVNERRQSGSLPPRLAVQPWKGDYQKPKNEGPKNRASKNLNAQKVKENQTNAPAATPAVPAPEA